MKRVLQALVFLALAGVFVALIGWRGTLLLAGVCYLGALAAEGRKRRSGRGHCGNLRLRTLDPPVSTARRPAPHPVNLVRFSPEEQRARWAEIDGCARQKMREEIASRQKSSDGTGPLP